MTILKTPFTDLLSKEEVDSLITDFYMSGFIRWIPEGVEFKSGMKSNVLVGGREDLTEHPFVLRKIGSLIARAVRKITPESAAVCLIGVPMTGNTFATAASLCDEFGLPFFMMRPAKKKHGAHKRWVDGDYASYEYYVTIDNTSTDGGSKFETIERLHEDGFYLESRVLHLVLVDRGLGAIDRLRAQGHETYALIDLPDVVQAFVEQDSWDNERLATLLEENSRYRLAF